MEGVFDNESEVWTMKKVLFLVLVAVLVSLVFNVDLAEFDNIRRGDKGEQVVEIQTILKELGFLEGKADGDFGRKTEAAVIAFQKDRGLDATGVVGEATYNALTNTGEEDTPTVVEGSDEVIKEEDAVDETTVTNAGDSSVTPNISFATDNADSDYVVTHEYKWSRYGYYNHALVIKNTSGYNAIISVTLLFHDANNNIIGVGNKSDGGYENGYESYWFFSNEAPYDHVSYSIKLEPDDIFLSCQSIINTTYTIVNRKAIITTTNIGSLTPAYVEYSVVFLDKNNDCVDSKTSYINMVLKPGSTEIREEECYAGGFSTVAIYIHSKAWK